MRAKIISFCLTFVFLYKQKKKYENERLLQCVKKTKKTMRTKIKIILINIWFNFSFDSCFCLKMLSWSSSFFSLNLSPIFEKLMQFGLLQ